LNDKIDEANEEVDDDRSKSVKIIEAIIKRA
jgi:hypothetical protein